jgi:hypothetical protein
MTASAPAVTADLLFEGARLFGVIMDCAIAFVFFERRTVALFADDASILDVNHSVGEAQYTRVVCDDQHSARTILGDSVDVAEVDNNILLQLDELKKEPVRLGKEVINPVSAAHEA